MDAHNHGLDGNLERAHVDFFHHLIYLCEHGFVIADHHHFVAGELVAARVGVVGGNADLGGSRNAEGADLFRQKRRDQRLQFRGRDVIGLVNSSVDLVQCLLQIIEIVGRADKYIISLAFGHVTRRFENRIQRAVEIHSVERGGYFAFHVLACQYVQIALLAEQIQHLVNVFVVDVDPQFAVALALDCRLNRGAGCLAWNGRGRCFIRRLCGRRQTFPQDFHHPGQPRLAL